MYYSYGWKVSELHIFIALKILMVIKYTWNSHIYCSSNFNGYQIQIFNTLEILVVVKVYFYEKMF